MDVVIINGEEYVKRTQATSKKIVILQRGWVMMGDFHKEGTQCVLENASVIRVWGTVKGLGEIALNGPTKNTVLDPCGRVEFHELTAVAILDCV